MGLVRKTLSIGTFGVVSFRSKKERLRRAERSQHDAETSLRDEHAARMAAETRSTRAQKRLKRASGEAALAGRRLERSKRRSRRHRKAETGLDVLASVEPIVRSGIEGARSARTDAVERSRKAGRRARKTTKRTLRRAKVTASSAKDAAAPHAERLAAQVGAVVDHLTVPDS
ncbi:MAG TPA: hypothetical protein VIK61_07580 [Acidimicrobiia bacterium]